MDSVQTQAIPAYYNCEPAIIRVEAVSGLDECADISSETKIDKVEIVESGQIIAEADIDRSLISWEPCPEETATVFDHQYERFTNDGGATVVKGYIRWDEEANTHRFYDFNNQELVGYEIYDEPAAPVLESDAEPMCDSGTTFWRHVVKENGTPTGDFHDTDINSQPYTTTGTVTPGACTVDTTKEVRIVRECGGRVEGERVQQAVEALVTNVVNTTGCNDEKRDSLLEKILDAVTQQTTSQSTQLAEIISQLTDANVSLQNIDQNTDQLEAQLTAEIAKLEEIRLAIVDNTASVDEVKTSVDAVKTSVDDLLPELQAINANTDTIEQLLTDANTRLQNIYDDMMKNDYEVSDWLPLCVDGTQRYVRDIQFTDGELAITSTAKEYKQGADGAITTTAPTGTVITEGACTLQLRETAICIPGATSYQNDGNFTEVAQKITGGADHTIEYDGSQGGTLFTKAGTTNEAYTISDMFPVNDSVEYEIEVTLQDTNITPSMTHFIGVVTFDENGNPMQTDTANAWNYGHGHNSGTYPSETTLTARYKGYNATNEGDRNKFDPFGKGAKVIFRPGYSGGAGSQTLLKSVKVTPIAGTFDNEKATRVTTYDSNGDVVSEKFYQNGEEIAKPTVYQEGDCVIPRTLSATTPTLETPNGRSFQGTSVYNVDGITGGPVKSLTISKERGSYVDVSFDGGSNYSLRINRNGSRTRSNDNGSDLDVSQVRVRGGNATTDYDLIRER